MIHPLIDRLVMSMNGADDVLVVALVDGTNRTYCSSYFINGSTSLPRKSWAYLILLLRVEIVVDVALDKALLLLGVFTNFIRFAHVLEITSLDLNVL